MHFFARAACGIAFGLFLTSGASAQVFNPQTMTLKNGLQIVVLPNERAPVITEMLWIKSGATDDKLNHSGAAHFMEHLMFKGTKNHADGDYSKIISHLGGTENAFTTQDYTAFYATFGKQHLPTVMALEADRFANWIVTAKQVASERLVILKERQQMTDNDPLSLFWEKVNKLLYIDPPYNRPVIGWKDEMEKLDKKIVEDYYKDHYTPQNAVLVLSGAVTLDEIKPLLEKNFGAVPSGGETPTLPPVVLPSKGVKLLNMASPLVQETIWSRHYLTMPARPKTIAQSDALIVLSKIFGDNRIGRLYRRLVVQDKIATSASVSYEALGKGPARWSIIVTPKPGVANTKIERAVNQEIAKILKKGVTRDEVANATQALEIDMIYARDSVSGPAMIVGKALSVGLDLATIENWPQRMRAVTKEAVAEQARLLFKSQKPLTAILVPEKK